MTRSTILALLCLLSPVQGQGGGDAIEFPVNLPKFSCASSGATSTPGTPVHLTSITTANGDKTILLAPLEAGEDGRMCILSRWSLGQAQQADGQGYYYPLGRSVATVSNGDWTKPPGKPGREVDYLCGVASNSGAEFTAGEYLCQVTLPWTREILPDFSTKNIFAPYYLTYYERSLTVRNEISRFLQKTTFGPTPEEIDALEAAHAVIMAGGLTSAQAMEQLQTEWTESQMDSTTFTSGSFSSLRKYWRQRVNARAFEVYKIGESGPAPCEKNSRWRKFAFTNYDVQNARYLRWGDDGVTTQNEKPHKVTVETVDLRSPTDPPVSAPTPLPVNPPTKRPVFVPTMSPTMSSAPTGSNILGYGDFELVDTNGTDSNATGPISVAWPSSCNTTLLDISTDDSADIHSGSKSYKVAGGSCSVLRMMGTGCPTDQMAVELQPGDTVKISLWVKLSEAAQVFQMFTAHYHPQKPGRWDRPKDDSHVISRTLIDNANKWVYIEAIHTVGDDWTFNGEMLTPKLCTHYQLRFSLASSAAASYIMDDVRIEKVSGLTADEKQIAFLRNPSFVSSHKMWLLSPSSGTVTYDDELGQKVMQIKKGQVLRQEVSASATPGESYSLGLYVRLINSARPVTLKIILRMRFTNNDLMYGPCKNPVCNLYERPVTATINAGSESWQHIAADEFEMYGDYTSWDGTVDFILFQVTTSGMTNAASLRIANFHDLKHTTAPPTLSLVPSSAPTTLTVEDVAYIVRYAGLIRTVVKHPFQIDETGEVLPMDGSVEYVLCAVEEVEGSLSESTEGLGFIVDDVCTRIRGGNPTVDLDPRYLNFTDLNILDLADSNVTSLEAINVDQTYGGDLLLQSAVKDEVCDTFPSPYDNDYRGASAENPDAVPNRFNPDDNVFALLPDGSYALYDPRLILRENSLESPLMDGGGSSVLRSTMRTQSSFSAGQTNRNIVLCSNEQPNFLNRDHCVLSYEENTCVVERVILNQKFYSNPHVNVQLTLTFDNDTLAALHNATAVSFKGANATANTTEVNSIKYIYAMSNLRYDDSNTDGSYPLPCMEGNPRSRWIPRNDLDASSCTNTLQASSAAALANALSNSNDQNIYLRDIYLWNSVAEDGCDATDALEYGMLVMTDNEGCWENVHPDHMSIYDFTKYVGQHPTSNPSDTSITGFSDSGIMEYPSNHPMSYFEALTRIYARQQILLLTPIARYGDMMIVDEFVSLVGIKSDPIAIEALEELGDIKLNNAINKNRGGGVLVCGSPNEVVPDPTLDDYFDVVHADLNCVGCQKSYPDYFAQKQTVWTINALEAEDQLCGRMAWALYELVNVGTTTAPDNTESNLYTYDIFKRLCFGNYYDILKEMSFNPKMGEQFGFVMSTSTRFRYDRTGELIYPDENYAREIMQLYTIGLHFLNDDGTEDCDKFGRVVQTYTNNDILSNARIWTGFEYTARRGNVEELFRANKSRQDPMRIEIDKHDFLPKLTLGGWIGDRYPLCSDLPNQHFLKIGAQYHLRGGTSVPSLQSTSEVWDADESVKRFVLSPTSTLYNKLCNPDDNGACQYSNTVVIDENLPCDGKECRVDTLTTVQVAPGVFYEYIRKACVHTAFYNDAKKVVSGIDRLIAANQYSHAMCADPKIASAARSCCDADGNRIANYNHKLEYHGERVTAATNEKQCDADGMSVCDPSKVITEGPLATANAFNVGYPTQNTFFWTDAACTQFVKIKSDGMIAIINEPAKNPDATSEFVVPFVSLASSVTYITMPWLKDIYTNDYLYPSSQHNSCDNGACSTLEDGSCLCPMTVSESAVYDSLPNRTELLSNLHVGGFDPSMYSDSPTPYNLVTQGSDVEAYSTGVIGDPSTIFKVTDEYGETLYLKNLLTTVTIGNSYTMRNPVAFINLAKVDVLDAVYEVEAFLKYLMRHQNTPAFVSKKLIQYLGVSNPTPGYALRVTQAFKQGIFSDKGKTFGDGTYGNLAAVAAAIILDPEALNVVIDDDPISGNVREPLLKVIQVLRSLSFTRRSEVKISTGLLKDIPRKIGQMVFQPPDQFSFFSSDYAPPGIFSDLDLVSPESQLLSMSSVVGITNGFFSLFNFGLSNADGGFGPFMSNKRIIGDYSYSVGHVTYQVNGTDISNRIDSLDTILTGGRLGAENKQVLTDAYQYFLEAHGNETADRVLMGLMAASPEFHTSNTLKKTGSKRVVTPPATKSSEPYKAIVYIYLAGGLDSFNLLAPHNEGGCYLYDNYLQARGGPDGVGLTIDEMLTIDGTSAGIEGCNTFGVNNLMSAYKGIYDEGRGIFLANMGHLHKPVTKSNWMTETRTDLFSHHTMKREAQYADAFREAAGPGVLGRMLDILEDQGHAVSATSVNVQALMVDGDPSTGRYADAMSTDALPKLFDRQFLNGRTGQEFRLFLEELNGDTTDNSGVMSNLWSQRFIDVWDKTDKLVNAMRGTTLQTAFSQSGPDIDAINQQLKLVAQLIAARDKRGNGVNRDVFFVQMGGFDTHSDMADILSDRLPALNRAVANFWAEIKAQGLSSSVTVVQGSEFGRTISANSNAGADHAWGGNYFMFGGDVAGGKILGEYPTSFDESDSRNIGRGRLIPSRSWDSLWHGITQWFGITEQKDIDYVLPNNQNFGCDLFTDSDLFTTGTNAIIGCGGPKFEIPANIEVTEPRVLIGEEQKGLCKICTGVASKLLGINAGQSRCYIADQVVTPVGGELYSISALAVLNFDLSIPPELVNSKINDIMAIASKTASARVILGAIPRTEAPSASPSIAPSVSSAPSSETPPPTRAPVAPVGLSFSSADIGYCAYSGVSYKTQDGMYHLEGSGADIWGTADGFHYMYVETSGDADVSIFVENFSKDKDEWAKAGVMFRASLTKDSAYYSSLLTGNNGVTNQLRRYNGYLTEQTNIASVDPASIWLRVTKVGDVMTAYYKEASSSFWVPYGKQSSIDSIRSSGYFIGVAITSHSNNNPQMATLQVSNVNLQRACTSESITADQCDQATNCVLGLRTSTCYDAGVIKTRRVKIQLPGTQYLHLAEVQVFNEYGQNVALNMPARMSSVYDPYYHPYPGDGVDGVIVDSMFHTGIEQGPWWEVDLGEKLAEVTEIAIYNREHVCDASCQSRANGAIVSLFDNRGHVFDTRVIEVASPRMILTFTPILIGSYQSVLPPKELEPAGYFEYFGEGFCRDSAEKLYDYLRFYIEGITPHVCQDKCIRHFSGLTGISTYRSTFCYCWYEDTELPTPLPSDVDSYSTNYVGKGEVTVTRNEPDGDCYMFFATVIDTETPTQMPSNSPTKKPTTLPPTNRPSASSTKEVTGFHFMGDGYCRDSKDNYYDYIRFDASAPSACATGCPRTDSFRGFSTYSTVYCYCWYDDNGLPSAPSDLTGVYLYEGFTGSGPLTRIYYTGYSTCYKFR